MSKHKTITPDAWPEHVYAGCLTRWKERVPLQALPSTLECVAAALEHPKSTREIPCNT